MKMTFAPAVALAATLGTTAMAGDNEFLFVTNVGANESSFVLLSYRTPMPNVLSGSYGIRADVSYSDFDLGTQTGTITNLRLGLTYNRAITDATEVTITGALSHRDRTPEGTSKLGYFASAELFSENARGDNLFLSAEIDNIDDTRFASAAYLFALGDFKIGPMANYLVEGDYSRVAAGATAAYDITDETELKVTAAWAEQDDGFNPVSDASYIEFQVRTSF